MKRIEIVTLDNRSWTLKQIDQQTFIIEPADMDNGVTVVGFERCKGNYTFTGKKSAMEVSVAFKNNYNQNVQIQYHENIEDRIARKIAEYQK